MAVGDSGRIGAVCSIAEITSEAVGAARVVVGVTNSPIGRIGLRGDAAGEIVAMRDLIRRPPGTVLLEDLALNQRPANRVVTIYRGVFNCSSDGITSAGVVVPETSLAIAGAVIEARDVRVDSGSVGVIDSRIA